MNWYSALQAYEFDAAVEIYELSVTGKNNLICGVHAGHQDYILRAYSSPVYEDFESISYENRMLSCLAETDIGFNVPIPILNRQGESVTLYDNRYVCLTHKFDGSTPKLDNLNEIEALGVAFGQLQNTLATCPKLVREGRSPFIQFFDFPKHYYDPFALRPADLNIQRVDMASELMLEHWRDEAVILDTFQKTDYQALPMQICHNDFTQNNVLVQDGQVSSVLDFEFMTLSPRVYDLAMVLRSIMRIWQNPEPWEIIRRFFRGYVQFVRLSESEIQALPMLIRLRSSMSILWWLGRNENVNRVFELIQYQQNFVDWLKQYQSQFLSVLYEASHQD